MSGKREQAQIPRAGPTVARALRAIRGLPLVLPRDWPRGGDVTEWRGDGAEWSGWSGERRHLDDLEAQIVFVVTSGGRAGTVDHGSPNSWAISHSKSRSLARGADDLVPPQGHSPDDRAATAALCNSTSQSVAVQKPTDDANNKYYATLI